MDEGRNMILLFPTLINFKSQEDRKKFDPTSAPHHHFPMHGQLLIIISTVVIYFTVVVS
jgi:hypothetical protein